MKTGSGQNTWYRQAAYAIRQHTVLKSVGTTSFICVFFVAYFYILRHPAYPSTEIPSIWLDRLISFEPRTLPLYLTLWLYISLPPALLLSRSELTRFGLSMALMCVFGLLLFYFWPTRAPVINVDWAKYPEMSFLKTLDASGNACPSLHVATALLSGVWMHHLLHRFGGPFWIKLCNGLWCIGIIYSTLATGQHVVIDVGAGLILGGITAWVSLYSRTYADVFAKMGNTLPKLP